MKVSSTKKNPVMLVVDDDPTFCHLMKKIGEQEKCQVIAYSSAQNAYQDMQGLDFDVAVIDFDLGRVNGAQLSNYMKRMKKKQPIMIVSSSSIEGDFGWSEQVMGVESKKNGAYSVFFSTLRAFDQYLESKVSF